MTPRLKFRHTDSETRLIKDVLWGVLAVLVVGAILADYFGRAQP